MERGQGCAGCSGWPQGPAQLGLLMRSGIDQYCSESGFPVPCTLHAMDNPVASSQLDQAVSSVQVSCAREKACDCPRSSSCKGGWHLTGWSLSQAGCGGLGWPGWCLWPWVLGASPLREEQVTPSHGEPAWRAVRGFLLLLWSRAATWARVGVAVRPGFESVPFWLSAREVVS